MRILFLTPQLPYPPRQGTQLRNYQIIRMAAGAHQVDLLSFIRPGDGTAIVDVCRKVETVPAPHRGRLFRVRSMFTSTKPDLARRLASRDFEVALCSLLKSNHYDIVQIEGLEMAIYISIALAEAPDTTTVIFDDHNVEHILQLRAARVDAGHFYSWPKAIYSVVQWAKLKRYERWACNSAGAVLAVSDADAEALRKIGVETPVAVVPNCIDVAWYKRPSEATSDPDTLLFTGSLDYRPNIDAVRWFVSAIFPRILARRPQTKFLIVGRSPSASVLRLAHRHPAIRVVGDVEDVRPFLFRGTVFVVPIRMAGGSRLKILEAMAAGLPVVSTTIGAEGLDLSRDADVLLADSPRAFADTIIRLLEDEDLRQQLGASGRKTVEEGYDWRHVAPRLLAVYDTAGADATG